MNLMAEMRKEAELYMKLMGLEKAIGSDSDECEDDDRSQDESGSSTNSEDEDDAPHSGSEGAWTLFRAFCDRVVDQNEQDEMEQDDSDESTGNCCSCGKPRYMGEEVPACG